MSLFRIFRFQGLVFAGLILSLLSMSESRADWLGEFCDVTHIGRSGTDEVNEAISAYNIIDPYTGLSACSRAIVLNHADGTEGGIPLPGGLVISQLAPRGQRGTNLRRCVYGSDGLCNMRDGDRITLDFSDFPGGDCPIRIAEGARVDFRNIRLLVRRRATAICRLGSDGRPLEIPRETGSGSEYVWLDNVTIDEAPETLPPPPSGCRLTRTRLPDGSYELEWYAPMATRVRITENESPLFEYNSPPRMVRPARIPVLAPTRVTRYELTTILSDGRTCTDSVTLGPRPSCNLVSNLLPDGNYALTWTTENAESATVTRRGEAAVLDRGLRRESADPLIVWAPAMPTDYVLNASASWSPEGCQDSETLRPLPPTYQPECSIDSPLSLRDGGYNISYATRNATSITWSASDGTSETLSAPSGNRRVNPERETIYTITVRNGDRSRSCEVRIVPRPTCTFSRVTASGGRLALTWRTTNADRVEVASAGGTLSEDPNPSSPVPIPFGVEATYVLTATGRGGTCTDQIPVSVDSTPRDSICELAASVNDAGAFELSWTTRGDATRLVTLEQEGPAGRTTLARDRNRLPSTPLVLPSGSRGTYVLTSTSVGSYCTQSITLEPGVPVGVIPQCSLSAPSVRGGGFDLSWVTTGGPERIVSLKQFRDGETATTLSTDQNSASPLHVDPETLTNYILSAEGARGRCSQSISLSREMRTVTASNDEDRDGIVDDNDRCLGTPARTQVNTHGCPDRDGDGVPDDENGNGRVDPEDDRCPTEFGPASNQGCPPPPPVSPTCEISRTTGENGRVRLSWNVTPTGASVRFGNGGTTPLSTNVSGTYEVPEGSTVTYTLAATNAGISCSGEISFIAGRVVPGEDPPTCRLDAGSGDNGSFVLSWTTSGARSVVFDEAGTRSLSTNPAGTYTVPDGSTATYNLTATNEGGSCTKSVNFKLTDPDPDNDHICNPGTRNPPSTCTMGPNGRGDNCPFVINENQSDEDKDGMGDACDISVDVSDRDGDGVSDSRDNCLNVSNADQQNIDQDAAGDACDTNPAVSPTDRDGDGVPDATDNCVNVINADQADSDGDGMGNACDPLFDAQGNGGSAGCGCRVNGRGDNASGGLMTVAAILPLVFMRLFKRRKAGIAIFLTMFVTVLSGTARADSFGEDYCDILSINSDSSSLFLDYVDAYNHSDTDLEACTIGIVFNHAGTVSMPNGRRLVITRLTPEERGTSIRKCDPRYDGLCLMGPGNQIILDFSQFSDPTVSDPNHRGDCPIKVEEGARINFENIVIRVPNRASAFCGLDGTPLLDSEMGRDSDYVYVNDLSLIQGRPRPLRRTNVEDVLTNVTSFDGRIFINYCLRDPGRCLASTGGVGGGSGRGGSGGGTAGASGSSGMSGAGGVSGASGSGGAVRGGAGASGSGGASGVSGSGGSSGVSGSGGASGGSGGSSASAGVGTAGSGGGSGGSGGSSGTGGTGGSSGSGGQAGSSGSGGTSGSSGSDGTAGMGGSSGSGGGGGSAGSGPVTDQNPNPNNDDAFDPFAGDGGCGCRMSSHPSSREKSDAFLILLPVLGLYWVRRKLFS